MNGDVLQSASDVIDELGGPTKVGKIVGRATNTVWNWRDRGRIPPDYFLSITAALGDRGKSASPEVFGMHAAAE